MRRGNTLGLVGWTAVAYALEPVTSLTSLNGCNHYAAIRAGGQTEIRLNKTEPGLWVGLYLPRSASSLTTLEMRCFRVSRGERERAM